MTGTTPEALRSFANIRTRDWPGKPHGRVILVESVLLPSDNAPNFGKLIDLEMMVLPGGRERTAAEFSAVRAGRVLADAGDPDAGAALGGRSTTLRPAHHP